MNSADTRFNQSVAKAFELLEAFSRQPGVLTLNELTALSGLDRNSTQRMLHTLVALGYVERGPNQRGYVLGKRILDRAFDFARGAPLLERATPVLADVQRACGERVDLTLFDDLSVVYVVRRQGKLPTFFSTLVGRRFPTFCNSGGRAVMAHLNAEEVDDILARSTLAPLTPMTLTDPDAIRAKVAQARRDGYAVSEQENMLGEIGLASAILDHQQRPIGAVHISGLLAEWDAATFRQRFSSLATSTALALSGRPAYT